MPQTLKSSSASFQLLSDLKVSSQTLPPSSTLARPSDGGNPISAKSLLRCGFLIPKSLLVAMGSFKEGSCMVPLLSTSSGGVSCTSRSSSLAMALDSSAVMNVGLAPRVVSGCTSRFPRLEDSLGVVDEGIRVVNLVSPSLSIPKPMKCYDRKMRDNIF